MMAWPTFACVLALLAACSTQAASAQTEAERIDALMARYHALGLFHGAVVVARDGDVVYEGGFGLADATWGVPNGPDVSYRIASVTKPITALLVFQEIERGALSLDAPAAGYLPDFPAPIDPRITVADLLIHASGIVDYANDLSDDEYAARYLYRRVPADSVVAAMVRRPLEFEPGTAHDYSNTGYVLIGLILEATSGTPYCDLVRERVTEPAGMTGTGCALFEPVVEGMATGYRLGDDGRLTHAPFEPSTYAEGVLYATPRDLVRLDAALREGRVLSPAMQAVMAEPRVLTDHVGDDMGLGLIHSEAYGVESVHRRPGAGADSVTAYAMGGGMPPAWTAMWYRVPEDGVTIAVMNNAGAPPPLYPELFDILYGRPYSLPAERTDTEAP
ncbi:serine hydrolase domain-containing protein [Rubrivirga sp. IMCC43871]|uniref:serine hydrolase domain-containing protein n=1 Tax=Rubrivirga sp. IMCC43871 TaxID=3391575 RepID=UPI00398FCAF1